MKVDNSEVLKVLQVPTHIDMWYDKSLKLWTLQLKDADDNQINDAIYVSGKRNARKTKIELENEYLK